MVPQLPAYVFVKLGGSSRARRDTSKLRSAVRLSSYDDGLLTLQHSITGTKDRREDGSYSCARYDANYSRSLSLYCRSQCGYK